MGRCQPTSKATKPAQGPAASITHPAEISPCLVLTPVILFPDFWSAFTSISVWNIAPCFLAALAKNVASRYGSIKPSSGNKANLLAFEASSHGTRSSTSVLSIQQKFSPSFNACLSRASKCLILASDSATRSPPTWCQLSDSSSSSQSNPIDSIV